jgi:hypothetical protein
VLPSSSVTSHPILRSRARWCAEVGRSRTGFQHLPRHGYLGELRDHATWANRERQLSTTFVRQRGWRRPRAEIGQIGPFAIRGASDELAPQVVIHPIEVGPAGSIQSGSLFKWPQIGGGVKPPNSRSMSPAKAIVLRSSRYPPMICTPIGRPLSLRPFGIVVAGSPFSVAMPAQAIRSL